MVRCFKIKKFCFKSNFKLQLVQIQYFEIIRDTAIKISHLELSKIFIMTLSSKLGTMLNFKFVFTRYRIVFKKFKCVLFVILIKYGLNYKLLSIVTINSQIFIGYIIFSKLVSLKFVYNLIVLQRHLVKIHGRIYLQFSHLQRRQIHDLAILIINTWKMLQTPKKLHSLNLWIKYVIANLMSTWAYVIYVYLQVIYFSAFRVFNCIIFDSLKYAVKSLLRDDSQFVVYDVYK